MPALGFFSCLTPPSSSEVPLAQVAIFIDGGYAARIAADHLHIWVDYEKLSNEIRNVVAAGSEEPVDLLRSYFYDCLPYQSDPPTPNEAARFSTKRKFFAALRRLPKYKVSGQSEPYLSPGCQCEGGSWLWCPRAEGKGS